MQALFYPNNKTSSWKPLIDDKQLRQLQKHVEKNISFYISGLSSDFDTFDENAAISWQFNLNKPDNSWISNNLKASPAICVWYSITTTDLIPATIQQNNNEKFSLLLTKFFSLHNYVDKIYICEQSEYIAIDVLTDLTSYSNSQLEALIDEEIKLRNIFEGNIFSFNYETEKNYIQDNKSILIYTKNG